MSIAGRKGGGRGAGPWYESESRKLLGYLNWERNENFRKSSTKMYSVMS